LVHCLEGVASGGGGGGMQQKVVIENVWKMVIDYVVEGGDQ